MKYVGNFRDINGNEYFSEAPNFIITEDNKNILNSFKRLAVLNFDANIEIGGIIIPNYSKGLLITHNSNDASLIAIDYNGNTYIGFRNNNTWQNMNKIEVVSEGTWTPKISTVEGVDPTVTYTTQRGYYKKVGNMVYVNFYIRGKITKLNGNNNYGLIKGLPFNTSNKYTFGTEALSLGVLYSLIANDTNANLVFMPGSDYIRIQAGYGTSATTLKTTTSNYFEIGGNGWYYIK